MEPGLPVLIQYEHRNIKKLLYCSWETLQCQMEKILRTEMWCHFFKTTASSNCRSLLGSCLKSTHVSTDGYPCRHVSAVLAGFVYQNQFVYVNTSLKSPKKTQVASNMHLFFDCQRKDVCYLFWKMAFVALSKLADQQHIKC